MSIRLIIYLSQVWSTGFYTVWVLQGSEAKENNLYYRQYLEPCKQTKLHFFHRKLTRTNSLSTEINTHWVVFFLALELIFLLCTGPKTMGMWRGGHKCAGKSRANSGFSHLIVSGNLRKIYANSYRYLRQML
jgi:hypothetical protein